MGSCIDCETANLPRLCSASEPSVEGQVGGPRRLRSGDLPKARSRPIRDTRITAFAALKRSLYSQLNLATPEGCLTPTGYTAYRQTGPAGLPLALCLSGVTNFSRPAISRERAHQSKTCQHQRK